GRSLRGWNSSAHGQYGCGPKDRGPPPAHSTWAACRIRPDDRLSRSSRLHPRPAAIWLRFRLDYSASSLLLRPAPALAAPRTPESSFFAVSSFRRCVAAVPGSELRPRSHDRSTAGFVIWGTIPSIAVPLRTKDLGAKTI